MPKYEVKPPQGYREAVVPMDKKRRVQSAMKQTNNKMVARTPVKTKFTKQVSEVDEQDSSKPVRSSTKVDFQTTNPTQVEEKMQKTVQLESDTPAAQESQQPKRADDAR